MIENIPIKRTLMRMGAVMALGVLGLVGSSCKKDKAKASEEHEEELITTVQLVFTKEGSSTPLTFTWKNLDEGAGGDHDDDDHDDERPLDVDRDVVRLERNSTYDLSVRLLNESVTPAENVGEEVAEEDLEHLMIFLPSSGLGFSYMYADMDSEGKPLGLKGKVTTAAASNGELRVVLRHEPTSKDNPQNLDATGGSTDVDVTYEAQIVRDNPQNLDATGGSTDVDVTYEAPIATSN